MNILFALNGEHSQTFPIRWPLTDQTERDPASNATSVILSLEECLLKSSVENGRHKLREFLLDTASLQAGSIGDALSQLARHPLTHRSAAVVLLRCLGIPGFLPEPNAATDSSIYG